MERIHVVDRERLTKIMTDKINEGYELLENIKITDGECARAIVNMLEFEATINQLAQQTAFDEEMKNKEVVEALDKNEDVEIEGWEE